MNAVWAVASYLVITAIIGAVAASKVKGTRDFFVAGGALPLIWLIPLFFAEIVAGASSVGTGETAHSTGITSTWFGASIGLGIILLGTVMAKFYRGIGKVSVGEAFHLVWGTRTRVAVTVVMLISAIVAFGAQPLALGAILAPVFGISLEAATWISMGAITLVALSGGIKGLAQMNFIHVAVLVISFTLGAILSVRAAGGMGTMVSNLPAGFLDYGREGWVTIGAWILGVGLSTIVNPHHVMMTYSAKTIMAAKIAGIAAGIFMIAFAYLPTLMGLSARVLLPDVSSKEATYAMAQYLGPGVEIVIVIGIVAAIFSSAPLFLLSSGTMMSKDVFRVLKPGASDRSELIFSRVSLLAVALLSTWFALSQGEILKLILNALSVRTPIALIILLAVVWKRIHPSVAFWTVVLGCGTAVLWFVFKGLNTGIEPVWPATVISVLIIILGSLIKKPSRQKGTEGLETEIQK